MSKIKNGGLDQYGKVYSHNGVGSKRVKVHKCLYVCFRGWAASERLSYVHDLIYKYSLLLNAVGTSLGHSDHAVAASASCSLGTKGAEVSSVKQESKQRTNLFTCSRDFILSR